MIVPRRTAPRRTLAFSVALGTALIGLTGVACRGGAHRREVPAVEFAIPDPLKGLDPQILVPPPDPPAAVAAEHPAPYKQRPAGTLTFARDIAPILRDNCIVCHHTGGLAPFALVTYDDVKEHAKQITKVTRSRYMPPWQPAHGYVAFEDERRLTDDQIGVIGQWYQDGAAAGDLARVPPPPSFPTGWRLGPPDLVVTIPRPYVLPAAGPDVFRNIVIPDVVPQEHYVRGVDFHNPGAPVIHHTEIRVDGTDVSRKLDEQDPEPGFGGMDPESAHYPDGFFLNWVPGKTARFEPPGQAWPLRPGTDLVVGLHLLPSGKPENVQPEVGLYFTDQPPADLAPVVVGLGTKRLDIPAGQADYLVRDAYRVPVDVTVLSVLPHAHYICRDMKGYAVLPDGSRKWIVRIKDWDFNWQDDFRLSQPLPLPAGSVVVMEYTYHNSSANDRNPHKPPQRIVFGPQSSDEMGDLWLRLLPRGKLDRQILQDSQIAHRYLLDLVNLETRLRDTPDSYLHQKAAQKYERLGRLDLAVAHQRQAVALTPEDATAHGLLALALQQVGDAAGAAAELQRAADLDPNDPVTRYNYALVLAGQGRLEDAAQQLADAVRLKPDYVKARLTLGKALIDLGRDTEAAAQFRAIVDADAENLPALVSLATVLAASRDASQRRPAEALAFAQRAVEKSGQRDADALRVLAAAQALGGDLGRATATAQRALDLAVGPAATAAIRQDLAQYAAGHTAELLPARGAR